MKDKGIGGVDAKEQRDQKIGKIFYVALEIILNDHIGTVGKNELGNSTY